MARNVGPTLSISEEVHATKYRSKNETFRDAVNRIANGLKDDHNHYHQFRDILMDMRFLPAGRVQSAVGAARSVTPLNCFVSGTIEDTFTAGPGSIMARASEAAETMRQGGGIGYDFSTLRPNGDLIKKLQSYSSGPIAFMDVYNSICKCVSSAGHRRGAQMGVMRIDHPDIMEFIRSKQPRAETALLWRHVEAMPEGPEKQGLIKALQSTLPLTGFNISVGVTDEFMNCLAAKKPFPLRFGGQVYREVDPEDLWDTLMRGTWDWAEPGVLFIDTINSMNNLWYCETIAATNPCGEQPLPPYGACLLGSFNLTRYLVQDEKQKWSLDKAQLKADMPHVVRAMDNIIDRAEYPLPEQGREARAKRRMGLGITGAANAFEAMGYSYGTPEYIEAQDQVLSLIRDLTYQCSIQLAVEKGAFAKLDREKYVDGAFIKTLPKSIRADIKKYGIRNSHLTSIAPTGTISLTADNISSSIEPVFSYSYDRTIIQADGPVTETIEDYGVRVLGVKGKRSADVTIDEHLNVLLSAAAHVDSAVSKTCNCGPDVSWEDFKNLYVRAYEGGAKGCTTFRVNGKRAGVLVAKDDTTPASDKEPESEGGACVYDPATGRRTCE